MSLLLLLRGDGLSADSPGPLGPPTPSGIGVALVAVLWAYEGWTYVTLWRRGSAPGAARVSRP